MNITITKRLAQILGAIHDNNASKAKFRSYFNSDCSETIRFIFDMQRYRDITNFQDPHSLFTALYDALSPSVQARLADNKRKTLIAQKQAIEAEVQKGDNNHNIKPTEEQYATAGVYKYESMETFFITYYRPQITTTKICGQLQRIVIRKNENTRIVLEHAKSAINYAKKTMELLNKPATTVGELTNQDIKDVLTYIFCTSNMISSKNDGGTKKKGPTKSLRKTMGP